MQYGTWPLPHHVHRSDFKKSLRNIRLTLSNPNDRNEWIKHVLLSPRKNDSCISCLKCNRPSKHRVTELFDAKVNSVHPYFQHDRLPMEHSSMKSSKTASNKSVKASSTCLKKESSKRRKASKSEDLVMQEENEMPLSTSQRKGDTKSMSRVCKEPDFPGSRKVVHTCEKFTRSMDECKWYLRELHGSNKSLGLIYTSSEISDASSSKDTWLETRRRMNIRYRNHRNRKLKENAKSKESLKYNDIIKEVGSMELSDEQSGNKNYLTVSNTMSPVLKIIDKHVLPSKLNIMFCREMMSQQSLTNVLVPPTFRLKKIVQTSEETLYQVKRKLESLHNVLRAYEVQNSEKVAIEGGHDGSHKVRDVCRNIVDTLVSITTEIDNMNENKRSRVSFDTDTRTNCQETPGMICNSSEQCESDEACKSSEISIQSCSNVSTTCQDASNNFQHSHGDEYRSKTYISNEQDQKNMNREIEIVKPLDSMKFERIPERVYYTLSSDSFEEKETTASEYEQFKDICHSENDQTKLFIFHNQQPIPMDTEEDLIITSPTSSHTEILKDSESDDKSMAFLLQEALEFKKALLSHVELQKSSSMYDEELQESTVEPVVENIALPCLNNNLQTKLLDIITEEQSVSSSTERTSRTYIFLNVKREQDSVEQSSFMNHDVIDTSKQHQMLNYNTEVRDYSNLKHVLCSSSEYFSFSNVVHDNNGVVDNSELCSFKKPWFQKIRPPEVVENELQVKYESTAKGQTSDERDIHTRSTNRSNDVEIDMYKEFDKTKDKKLSPRIKDFNEFITLNVERAQNNVQTFLRNINERTIQGIDEDTNIRSNFPSSTCIKECANETDINNTEDTFLDKNMCLLNEEKYCEEPEALNCHPNLTLKRHPGMCSLIKQTESTTHIGEGPEMRKMFENTYTTFDSSPSESKDTSIDANVSTPHMNHSNDSNILEPLSMTALPDQFVNEEKLNLKWQENYIHHDDTKILSESTITMHKLDVEEQAYGEEMASIKKREITENCFNQKDESREMNHISSIENCSIIQNQGDATNGTSLSKSYQNLTSPRSSLYFTDEASSSTAKLNTIRCEYLQDQLNSNCSMQTVDIETTTNMSQYETKKARQYIGDELQCATISNKHHEESDIITPYDKKMYTEILREDITKEALRTSIENQDSKDSVNSSTNDTENTHTSPIKKVIKTRSEEKGIHFQPTSKNKNLDKNVTSHRDPNTNVLILTSNTNLSNDIPTHNPLVNEIDTSSVLLNNNVGLIEMSPRNIQGNATVNEISILISNNNQNSTSKHGGVKKSITTEKIKGLQTVLLQPKAGSNTNLTNARTRDLSVESRRGIEHNNNLQKKRSRSQISFRTKDFSSQHAISLASISPINSSTNQNVTTDNKLKVKTQLRSLIPTSKVSSRSCIPILRSRLEAARRIENENRPKSPMRGPLTMTMLWKDNSFKNRNISDEVVQAEGIPESRSQCIAELNSSVEKSNEEHSYSEKQCSLNDHDINGTTKNIRTNNVFPQERMIIYVNIFTKYNQNTTRIVDPNKFLEYIENREKNVQDMLNEKRAIMQNMCDEKVPAIMAEQDENAIHKVVTIVSSVINGNDLKEFNLNNSPISKTKDIPSSTTLFDNKLKNVCFLSVEQREVDVTAKPSVIDTSTSISDLEGAAEVSDTALNKFQICGTPRELNNEEYIALLEILNQEPNFIHLQELQNLCKNVTTEQENSK